MMYYLHDLYKDSVTQFETERDLVFFWRRKFGNDFGQLNVTGCDTYPLLVRTGKINYVPEKPDGSGGYYIHETKIEYFTRRYLITDEFNRNIDIRRLDKTLWTMPLPERKWSFSYHVTGRRRRNHRHNGPSMRRRQLRADTNDYKTDLLELYPDLNPPVKDNTKIRVKAKVNLADTDYYHERMYSHGYYESRSWKDQRKNRKQYNRHNTTTKPEYNRHITTELDFDELLKQLENN